MGILHESKFLLMLSHKSVVSFFLMQVRLYTTLNLTKLVYIYQVRQKWMNTSLHRKSGMWGEYIETGPLEVMSENCHLRSPVRSYYKVLHMNKPLQHKVAYDQTPQFLSNDSSYGKCFELAQIRCRTNMYLADTDFVKKISKFLSGYSNGHKQGYSKKTKSFHFKLMIFTTTGDLNLSLTQLLMWEQWLTKKPIKLAGKLSIMAWYNRMRKLWDLENTSSCT